MISQPAFFMRWGCGFFSLNLFCSRCHEAVTLRNRLNIRPVSLLPDKQLKGMTMVETIRSGLFWAGFGAGILFLFACSLSFLGLFVFADWWRNRKPHWITDIAGDEDGIVPVCSRCGFAVRWGHEEHERECWK